MAEVVNYVSYKCSIYYNNIYVGTESIILYNKNSQEKDYYIEFINGTQIFKYDENGISPCDSTKTNPQDILPLSFNIINKDGLDITDEILSRCQVDWAVPEENTLIILPEGADTHTRQLTFTIDDIYDNTKTNNTIQLTVQYKGNKIIEYTNLTFLKEGDVGTNGTDCYCTIVPNTTQQVDYPMIINGVLNYTPAQTGKWFKAQVWRSGKLLFEGADSGNSIDNKTVSIRWSVKKNKYNAQISDPSTINVTTNIFSTTGYYQEDGSGANCPANIIQCRIIYNQIEYYVTMPIITVSYNTPYQLYLEPRTGFNFVTYSSDGRYPKYNDNKPFEIQVMQTINGVKENISLLNSNQYGVKFEWYIRGQVYDTLTGLWVDKVLFEIDETETLNKNQIKLIPVSEYSGECVSTGLECICKKKLDNTTIIGKIHIPIHCMLNRYANAAINSWDGNSVEINDTDGYILTPQVGAGTKDEQNRFTGMLMGSVKDNSNHVTKTGLLGYDAGQQSLFLDAESGGAIFGKDLDGQITIDPQSNKSYLFSHNYWQDYNDKGFPSSYENSNMTGEGLLIDLATPQIKYGDGTKFGIDAEGNLTCRNLINSDGILSILQMQSRRGLCGTHISFDDGTDGNGNQYFTRINYFANAVAVQCLIPDNFTLQKAEVVITTNPNVTPVTPSDFGADENISSFPNYVWGIVGDTSFGWGYCHKTPTMQLGVYALEDTAFYSTVGGNAYSDVFWSDSYVDISQGTLLNSFSGFVDLDDRNVSPNFYGNYYGKAETKVIDITTGLNQYLNSHNTNICRIAVGPTPSAIPASVSLSRTWVSGQHKYRYTPRLTPYTVGASHTDGEVTVEVYLYGYYKKNIND